MKSGTGWDDDADDDYCLRESTVEVEVEVEAEELRKSEQESFSEPKNRLSILYAMSGGQVKKNQHTHTHCGEVCENVPIVVQNKTICKTTSHSERST